MRALSLFSGIGGIDLAGEWAGINTVAFCEREPYPVKVLRHRFPGIPIYDDVCKLTAKQLEEDGLLGADRAIDLISGGFPCQPFSNAGKRGGASDDRYLWPEMFRIITEVRPTWVVAENVDGLISMDQSDGEFVLEDATTVCKDSEMVLETIRRDFAEAGYDSVPIVIPSAAVGAPHRRDRVFILGYTEHSRSYGTTFGRSFDSSSDNDKERENKTFQSSGTSRSKNDGALADSSSSGLQKWRQPIIARGDEKNGTGMEPESERCCENVANTTGERCGETRELQCGGTEERATGSGEDVANTYSDTSRGLPIGEGTKNTRPAFGSQDVADTNVSGTQRSADARSISKNGTESRNKHFGRLGSDDAGRAIESILGRNADGLSGWLDGFRWPAGLGQEQCPWEPPRVATGVKHRAARLKALGNAVNPMQILPILYFIKQINDHLKAK